MEKHSYDLADIMLKWTALVGVLAVFVAFAFFMSNTHEKSLLTTKIKTLELKISELERADKLSPALRQILTPQAWDELSAMSEELKQRKERTK
ncbi:hypothetical protein KAR91_43935 [Candidatus Pacearchaeota archaeon]|nr:hypothetical protein [Candidatus Pacearchaeota archaeon]